MIKHLPHNHQQGLARGMIQLPNKDSFENAAEALRLLSDTRRLQIFWLLCHCEECVINISAIMEMTSPAIAHHLKQLKAGGLIVSRREGKEVYYKASDTPTAHLLHNIAEELLKNSVSENKGAL